MTEKIVMLITNRRPYKRNVNGEMPMKQVVQDGGKMTNVLGDPQLPEMRKTS